MNYYNLTSITPGTKILFANFPADGHFNPLTGLAVHLKKQGCDVRWYTSPYYAPKIESLDIPFYGLKKAKDVSTHQDIDVIFPERKKHKTQVAKLKFDMINAFILRAPEYYQDLIEIHKEFPFDLMIADICFGGIPFVKEKMQIPVIAISVVPLPETSKDLPPSGLGLTPSYNVFGKLKQSFLRLLADKMLFAQPTRVMTKMLNQYGIDTGKANIFDILIRKSTLVLQSGTPGFEYDRSDLSNHIYFAGPLLPYSKKKVKTTPWTHEKLGRFGKAVLVTQGTVERDVEKLLVPTLEALKDSDYLVIATTGGSRTEELKSRFPHDNIIIEDFIPFDEVMPHVDVYVSNGGYGGVLLSIQNNLPMVVAGIHEGKNEINARVGYFKLGKNLRTERPTVSRLRKSIEAVTTNDIFRERVTKLNEEFSHYRPEEICAYHVRRLTAGQVRVQKKKDTAEVI